MKKLYSIGETAKITGISVQTLRNYSNFSFLHPAYINEESGYRYFSFDQFHIIDRIKYLRSLGLSLKEIEEIMMDGKKTDKIIAYLEDREKAIEAQIHELTEMRQDTQNYINYFKHIDTSFPQPSVYIRHINERYILSTPCDSNDTIEDIEVRLARMKSDYSENNLHFFRQFGYLLDYQNILQQNWQPHKYFTYIADTDIGNCESLYTADTNIQKFPEGSYLCLRFRLRHMDEINIHQIKKYFPLNQ